MNPQAFGNDHTLKKLAAVQTYLHMFTTALKGPSRTRRFTFDLIYIDACAGSGFSVKKSALRKSSKNSDQLPLLPMDEPAIDPDEIIEGSAVRALGLEIPFDKYLFNDLKRANVTALKNQVAKNFPHLEDRVHVTKLDANEMLHDVCDRTNWKTTRAVVFLDPFGLQIKYETLERLARTQAVDVWYLVNVFAMFRQVRNDGIVIEDGGRSVDDALGTTDWRNVVAIEKLGQIDMFGEIEASQAKAVDIKWFESVAKQRLGEAFEGRVLEKVLPLGKGTLHEFSLMFAWANPSKPAELAAKFAKAVLK